MTEPELRVVPDVSAHELTALAARLITFPTDSQSTGNPGFHAASTACHDMIIGALSGSDFEFERFDTPTGHPTTVARLRGRGGGRTLVLNGHIDVVPSGAHAEWKHDPYAGIVEDGYLYGRGAADMKAGVAAIVLAAQTIARAGDRPAGDLVLHIVSDEEIAGTGSREAIARLDDEAAVIICEPTNLQIVTVHGGLLHLRIEIDGVGAHAGLRYASLHPGHDGGGGVNAIEKAFALGAGLQQLEREWATKAPEPLLPAGFNTIAPGLVLGGPGGGANGRLSVIGNPGTTPDYCALEYNIWFLPWERRDDVVAEVEKHIHHLCESDPWMRVHPPRLTWGFNGIDVPAAKIESDHPLTEALSSALAGLGRDPRIEGFTAASELGWYAEQGIPGVLFGPGRIDEAHSTDEHVKTRDIATCARALLACCTTYTNLARG
jgi:acetylornithine deacetylase/succinyl-diaminopimelate desuccinylase family protein